MKTEFDQAVDKISIPFVTSDGDISRLYLPMKMSVSDARRLKRMINALYINQQSGALSNSNTNLTQKKENKWQTSM